MISYLFRRLLLLPVTLFFIIVVNFVIINLAPGEPTSVTEVSPTGQATRREEGAAAAAGADRYLQFRERYGLTLPVLFNTWPSLAQDYVDETLHKLTNRESLSFKEQQDLRIRFGDQARFIMPKLFHVFASDAPLPIKKEAMRFVIRGGTRQGILGGNLSDEQRALNRDISEQNLFLQDQFPLKNETPAATQEKIARLSEWYEENQSRFLFSAGETFQIFWTDTRFFRYFSRVLTLDFGSLRDDPNKSVVSEVASRFKYSLTLSAAPMVITFALCMIFGLVMALFHGRLIDHGLNTLFLILYAIPVFVVAPFLIEEVAMKYGLPFSGFTSPESLYSSQNSLERAADIARHIFLPIVAIMYGSLATQSRLARTAVLEVAKQDFVRTAHAKGLKRRHIYTRYLGRNASITIVTALAGSLGVLLGGSLIVEILFEIDGFGKFFYDAVLNRDYNVIMFSAIAGSFLTLVGYLAADISYMLLDPRVTLQ